MYINQLEHPRLINLHSFQHVPLHTVDEVSSYKYNNSSQIHQSISFFLFLLA